MADRHDLHIRIDENGEVSIEVKGVDGPQCVLMTRELEEELGIVREQVKHSEYYKEETTAEVNVEQSGGGGQ